MAKVASTYVMLVVLWYVSTWWLSGGAPALTHGPEKPGGELWAVCHPVVSFLCGLSLCIVSGVRGGGWGTLRTLSLLREVAVPSYRDMYDSRRWSVETGTMHRLRHTDTFYVQVSRSTSAATRVSWVS